MKRPLIYGGLGILLGALAGTFGYWSVPLLVVGLLIICFRTQQLNGYTYANLIFGLIGAICFVYVLTCHMSYDQEIQTLSTLDSIKGVGVIKEVHTGNYSTIYTVYPWWDGNGVRQPFAINIRSNDLSAIGYRISFQGHLLEQMNGYNEGGFDGARYYKEQQIIGLIKGDVFNDRLTGHYRIRRWLQGLRESNYQQLIQLLPERHSRVIGNLLLGIDEVEETDQALFQRSGIIHILAISGLHVTLIAGMLLWLIKRISSNQRLNAMVVFLLIMMYCIYTGGHTSTVRATIMIGIYLGHQIFYRKYDKHTAVMIALVAMILMNPFQLFSAGLLLSFGAVFSIFYLTPKLKGGFMSGDHSLIQTLRLMLAIQLGMLPLLVYFFGHIPLYSLLANMLVLPIVALIIAFSGFGIIFSYLHLILGKWVAGGAFWLVTYMFDVVSLINRLPYSYIAVKNPGVHLIVLYYVTLILWVFSYKKLTVSMAMVMLTMMVISNVLVRDELVIDMMDVGNGDAIFVRGQGQVMLFDGGGEVGKDDPNVGTRVLMPYLSYHGIKSIDTVVISHSDFDHIYGIIELMGQVPIGRLVLPSSYLHWDNDWSRRLKQLATHHHIELLYAENGDHIDIGNLSLNFLYPLDNEAHKDNNSNSTVVLLVYEDFEMLFTGDIGVDDESLLLGKHKELVTDIDVLKVAHHGSKTSSDEAFIAAASPAVSLVSVGRANIYGHPAKSVEDRLNRYSTHVYMTKECGQITLTYKDGRLEVDPFIE